jgi:uncharacterized membrane protein
LVGEELQITSIFPSCFQTSKKRNLPNAYDVMTGKKGGKGGGGGGDGGGSLVK